MTSALQEHGLESPNVELTAALRMALKNVDARERWLAGAPVFAGGEANGVSEPRRRLAVAP
jgi:hypothetical protein